MMSDLVLNPWTKQAINNILNSKPHFLLITGKKGIGKLSIARFIASRLLQVGQITQAEFVLEVSSKSNSISIDEVRQIQSYLKLKVPGNSDIRRIILVDDAQDMTIEAQNAFLKLLEEPPKDTVIIFCTYLVEGLLPTIVSRAQRLEISAPAAEDVKQYFSKDYSKEEIEKAMTVARNLPGLVQDLLSNQDNELKHSINEAKQLLSQPKLGRIAGINRLVNQKKSLNELISALIIIAQAGLEAAIAKRDYHAQSKWVGILKSALKTQDLIGKNVNTKLLLTDLFVKI